MNTCLKDKVFEGMEQLQASEKMLIFISLLFLKYFFQGYFQFYTGPQI